MKSAYFLMLLFANFKGVTEQWCVQWSLMISNCFRIGDYVQVHIKGRATGFQVYFATVREFNY